MSKLTHEFKDGRHTFTKDLCCFSLTTDELPELVAAASAALAATGDRSFPQPVQAICLERRMSMDEYLRDADEELQMYEDRDRG